MATIPEPQPGPPEIPVPNPDDHPERDEPIEPTMNVPRRDPLPPETVNRSQEDEDTQGQTVASASAAGDGDFALEDSEKVSAQGADDDVQDLVDHMHSMVRSGRIDMDAYRGERNDDDEDGAYGPGAQDD